MTSALPRSAFCLVLVTAFVAALGPRALEAVADRSLRTELGAATPLDRDLELSQVVPSDPAAPASLAIVDAAGDSGCGRSSRHPSRA